MRNTGLFDYLAHIDWDTFEQRSIITDSGHVYIFIHFFFRTAIAKEGVNANESCSAGMFTQGATKFTRVGAPGTFTALISTLLNARTFWSSVLHAMQISTMP